MPRWSLVLAYLIITATFVVTASWSHDASSHAAAVAARVDREATVRVNEACLASKLRYRVAVSSLSRTYSFLEQSSPSERKSTINRFILAGLDKQEKDLKGIKPASFCKGIGPPVPPVPKRPPSI